MNDIKMCSIPDITRIDALSIASLQLIADENQIMQRHQKHTFYPGSSDRKIAIRNALSASMQLPNGDLCDIKATID